MATFFLELRNGDHAFVSLVPFSDLAFVDELFGRFGDLTAAFGIGVEILAGFGLHGFALFQISAKRDRLNRFHCPLGKLCSS